MVSTPQHAALVARSAVTSTLAAGSGGVAALAVNFALTRWVLRLHECLP